MTTSAIDPLTTFQDSAGNEARPRSRVEAIDWVRGAIMILMALDHVRFFFTDGAIVPEDMERTWPALFFTRWVTHFCAPLFFLLAGMSAWLSSRGTDRRSASRHLLARGALLIALEFTVVGFGWNFTPGYSFAGVIWALGWSMIALSVLSRFPSPWLLGLSIAVVAGHDALNGLKPESFGPFEAFWRFLHVPGGVRVFGVDYFVLYALVPWFAVMLLGFACGSVWELEPAKRQRVLLFSGMTSTILFVLLRVTNGYGNPVGEFGARLPFRVHDDGAMTIVSLLNVSKYPGSFQFLLMTLGPGLIALALADRLSTRPRQSIVSSAVKTIGRVPMFYYVAHLYLIHLLALAVGVMTGEEAAWLGWRGAASPPAGYGFGLPVVYAVWLLTLLLLWFPSRSVDRLKRSHRSPWLRYV